MTQEFEVSVEELLRTLKRRGIPLPSEMGAFITLEVCEQVLDRPAALSTQEVAISEIGEVLCASELAAASEDDAVRALLALLGDLLVCSAPGVPSMLLELVEREPGAGQLTLEGLRDDLEACLLPLNRGATRRVLSRLLREARKAGPSQRAKSSEPPGPSAQPSAADIDAQFDALLGDAKASSPMKVRAKPIQQQPLRTPRGSFSAEARPLPSPRRDETPITAPMPGGMLGDGALQPTAANSALPETSPGTLSSASELPPTTPGTLAAPVRAAAAERARAEAESDEPSDAGARVRDPGAGAGAFTRERNASPLPDAPRLRLATETEGGPERPRRARGRGAELDTDGLVEADPNAKRTGSWILGLAVLASVGLLGAYFALGREGARNALGLLPASAPAVEAPIAPVKVKTARGDLKVNSTPDKAQVLLLIGRGPALATDLPLGVAQEFVAIADGYLPARALVPADAVWEEVEGKPRYELAIQARPASGNKPLGLGATLLPRDVGAPQSKLGSVRVITTPKGAKVYQLIGFTPDVQVENLPLDQDYEVLVALEGHSSVTQQLTAADFTPVAGKQTASVQVELTKK